MGFQIVNVYNNLSPQGIFSGNYSAGLSQTVICAPFVHLTAVVSGDDITEHETLWEQISGDTVYFLESPYNTLEVSYSQPSTGLDRKFRFWIDKGTENQIYSDTEILSTIRETMYSNITYNNNVEESFYNFINMVKKEALSGFPAPPNYIVDRTGISFVNVEDNWLLWTLPNVVGTTIVEVELQEYQNNNWVTVKTLLPTSTQYYNSGKYNVFYRINTTETIGRVKQKYIGEPGLISNSRNIQIVDSIPLISGVQPVVNDYVINVNLLTIKYLNGDSDILNDKISYQSVVNDVVKVVNLLTIKYLNGDSDILNGNISNQQLIIDFSKVVNIPTRLSVGG